MAATSSPRLEKWDDLRPRMGDDVSLPVGNGASQAVWPDVGYQSLFLEAHRETRMPMYRQGGRLAEDVVPEQYRARIAEL